MTGPTALEKIEREYDNLKTILVVYENRFSRHDTSPMSQIEVGYYAGKAESILEKFLESHRKILQAVPETAEYEQQCMDFISRVANLTCGLEALRVPGTSPSTTSNSTATSRPTIRLPRLELPKFSGEITDWLSFSDQFTAAIHNDVTLADSQKLTYLKSALTGDAERLVKSLTTTDSNYGIAWTSLQERFANDRENIFAILKRLCSQPAVLGESATGLRSIVDVTRECFRSLQTLQVPVASWDCILVFLLLQKTDTETRKFWELSLPDKKAPELAKFLEFLEIRARSLAAGGIGKSTQGKVHADARSHPIAKHVHTHHSNTRESRHSQPQSKSNSKCKFCGSTHPMYSCTSFSNLDTKARREAVLRLKLCFNCLRENHQAMECSSRFKCKNCGDAHHTLLHISTASSVSPSQPSQSTDTTQQVQSTQSINAPTVTVKSNHAHHTSQLTQGLLATAIVRVVDKYNEPQLCRVVMDSGSTTSFVTEACAKRLGLVRTKTSVLVSGIGGVDAGDSTAMISAVLQPYFHTMDSPSFPINLLIKSIVTSKMPTQKLNRDQWTHLNGLQLADPSFHKPAKVDMLLGSEIVWDLLLDGRRNGPPGTPIARLSHFGWLIAGKLDEPPVLVHTHMADVSLDHRLQQFWELESLPTSRILTKEEKECEEHFVSTHKRDDSGKYVVSLPFKSNSLLQGSSSVESLPGSGSLNQYRVFGASRDMAMQRLRSLERRLHRQPDQRKLYIEFMEKYISLGHMVQIPPEEISPPLSSYYIPHHYVQKDSDKTSKFRVVFDASAKTSNGVSLNDQLMVGPTIQDSLIDVLMRFRIHPFAFTADISKMYRQIWMTPAHQDWQRILWRGDPTKEVQEYQLKTVTYGTASAPFLATRVLQQLGHDEADSLPIAAAIAKRDFYVDDLMTGAATLDEALQLQCQLRELTRRGGFPLCKFSASHPALLSSLPLDQLGTQLPLNLDKDDSVKTLGLYWNTGKDCFTFKVNLPPLNSKVTITKRSLLSEMSMVFDPLGWLSPITIRTKIMFQRLWKTECSWDDPLPEQILKAWLNYRQHLPKIENLELSRCVIPPETTHLSLHGFSDASELAYSAVVYLRSEQQTGPAAVSLIAAKTRVSPSKFVSIPRLELCGALLLSKLMSTIQNALKVDIPQLNTWTDSTAVLDWIKSHPSRWKVFVANRVTEIQDGIQTTWGHVAGVDNPADSASRGISPHDLLTDPLWWHGPMWLSKFGHPPEYAPIESSDSLDIERERRPVVLMTTVHSSPTPVQSHFSQILHNNSSLIRLQHITAWCQRFAHNIKTGYFNKKSCDPPMVKKSGILTAKELDDSLLFWIKIVKHQEFGHEVKCLLNEKPLPLKSRILPLNPFLDKLQMIRVGGRLRHSTLATDQKHPFLLPRHHHLTKLIVNYNHLRSLHGGPQLVLSLIQQRFWILGAKDAIRLQLKKCVVCTRYNAPPMQQLMSDLPAVRITPTRVFQSCGVDYAGPFVVRAISGRSKVTHKAYLALFVCFAVRAIHLELVSSLTTDAFLAALKRFTARRGRPQHIYSDCGTNFVGAAREIKELLALVNADVHNSAIASSLATDSITWHFNPPGSPHFGGIWEAGVKSVKHHLHRVIGSTRLTFEELSTVFIQIEACLNSRPLTPCSSNPNDLTALTPGHFLIGAPLTAIPEPDLTNLNQNRLVRWQQTQQMVQQFWKRWSNEYLARLQQRPKWLQLKETIKIGDMVIIRHEFLPPQSWKLGRVSTLHPGPDGITRVVSVTTSDGELKRPIAKLTLLSLDSTIQHPSEEPL